ncbi:MAG: 30S ribosomal protein S12 methylthiotransferase RimO [Nitrospirae bacterium]|nr:30S ribosomal protein S12 methylthiotransferase RimO [Nitrospirota bacterium]
MKFYLISLGCAKNLVDSEKITERLQKESYFITDDINEASFIFINTCGFIKEAKQESIDTIFTVLEEKPQHAKILVYGCLAQRYLKELKKLIPEIDLFLPLLPHDELIKEIKRHVTAQRKLRCKLQKRIVFTPPSYTYIKISEGCSNSCSYCAIPVIRGHLKSCPVENIISQIKNALDKGYYEINLIAQDITAYGTDLYGKPSLNVLLKKVLSIKKDFWLRLLYLHPSRISSELVKIIMSDSRIVKYLDIPIQHVNNRILKLMNRFYTKDLLIDKIGMLREKIPSIALRTSLIAGFPTENEEDFQELLDFVRTIKFAHLGVFEYSREEDTKASSLKPLVPTAAKEKRKKIIMKAQKDIVKLNNKTLQGKVFPCIVELPVDEYGCIWTGRIYSQAPEVDGLVYVTGYEKTMGNITNVSIKGFKDYDLTAECIR